MKKTSIFNTKKKFETIVIGGGITGAGVFRDLALHGVDCLLIDKSDFTSKTSQSSSKLLHGGIRYLENYDFDLVSEALKEKNLWTRLLPHLAKEIPFVLPIYKDSKYPLFMLKIGLVLYDLLSGFKNSPHRILSKKETMSERPLLNKNNLLGSGLYYDALMDDIKITLEVIYDALLEKNASCANHTELTSVSKNSDHYSLTVIDQLTKEEFIIEAKFLVFSLGPYTDKVLAKLFPKVWVNQLLPSKGSHLWFSKEKFPLADPCVINHKDGRVIFFIPHDDLILVGTTEEEVSGSFDSIDISEKETNYLMSIVNHYYPELPLTKEDILSTYSGVRPLIRENGNNEKGKTARTHRTYQFEDSAFAIMGGKYTTFRVMAQESVKSICHKLNITYIKNKTLSPLRQKSISLNDSCTPPVGEELVRLIKSEYPRTLEDLVHRRLGLYSKKHWSIKYKDYDFQRFIKDNSSVLKSHLELGPEDPIEYFK